MNAASLSRRLPLCLALLVVALAAALEPSLARAGEPCTPEGSWKVSVELGHARAITDRLNSERAAAGIPPLTASPQLTKTAMFRALQLAGQGHDRIDASALADACGISGAWGMNWQWSPRGATRVFLDTWLGDASNLRSRARDSKWAAVGVGAARNADGLIHMAVVFGGDASDADGAAWPIEGWPTFPTSAAPPPSGDDPPSIPDPDEPSGTRVCFAADSCARVRLSVDWEDARILEPGVDDRAIGVCAHASSMSGELLKVEPLLAGSRLTVHVDSWSARLAPAWKLSSGGLSRCATVAVPASAPRFGSHSIWFTLDVNGTNVPSAKTEYGKAFFVIYPDTRKVRQHWLNRNKLEILVPMRSELFRYATAAVPITVVCQQKRAGRNPVVATTVKITRATTKPVYCRFTLPRGRVDWVLSATVKRTAQLTALLNGAKLHSNGLLFRMS